MKGFNSSQVILGFVAAAVAAGHLWVPDPAQAAAGALFRVKRSWHGDWDTTPDGYRYPDTFTSPSSQPRGGSMGYVTCTTNTTGGGYGYKCYDHPNTMAKMPPFNYEPAGIATVGDTTPTPKFSWPRGFIHFGTTTPYTWSCVPGTCSPGYPVSIYYYSIYNYRGFFQPQNPFAPNAFTVVTFPTVGGTPMVKDGTAVTPTTTFDGRFDQYRAGSIKITPGPNRFGGTMRYFYGPNARWYQFITNTTPYERGYGHFWRDGGITTFTTPEGGSWRRRTGNQAVSENSDQYVGQIYPVFEITRINTGLTTGGGELATRMAQYIYTIAPHTTGKIEIYQPLGPTVSTATLTGYDNRTPQGLYGKMSLIVPWLTHVYVESYNPADPVLSPWHNTRINRFVVTFLGETMLPEPGAILLLGAGIMGLAGLYRLRRR